MDVYYTIKSQLKTVRWQGRRALVALRWGASSLQDTPAVLGNAMPKSGSHLIIQVLQGLTQLGPFVNPGFPPVNRDEANRKLPDEAVLDNILRLRHGDIGYGYLQARQPFIDTLTRPGIASVFVYRDPRDVIVSHVFYATEMYEGHGMHNYYTEVLGSMEERINAAIQGVEGYGAELSSVREKYLNYPVLHVAGDHAYVAEGGVWTGSSYLGVVEILDVSDPAHPVRVGGFSFGGSIIGLQVVGNYAYLAERPSCGETNCVGALKIFDVSDPANPLRVGRMDLGEFGRQVENFHVGGRYACFAEERWTGPNRGGTLEIVDVGDPANPSRVGSYDTRAYIHDVHVAGDNAYLAEGLRYTGSLLRMF